MTPVTYSAASRAIVEAFEARRADQQAPAYWNSDAANPVRGEIKAHYIAAQAFRCIYCDRQIVTSNHALWDAEHVIARASAVRFMFTPENLAVSCRDCNIAKGEREVRRNPRRKSFPRGSEHYLIVHPHFDNYADHIRWFGDICTPVSEKGQETLIACDLTRFTARLLGTVGIMVDPTFDRLVGQLIKTGSNLEALSILEALKVYVVGLPG